MLDRLERHWLGQKVYLGAINRTVVTFAAAEDDCFCFCFVLFVVNSGRGGP